MTESSGVDAGFGEWVDSEGGGELGKGGASSFSGEEKVVPSTWNRPPMSDDILSDVELFTEFCEPSRDLLRDPGL